jgi:uncharacterized protein (DUF488 family)
LPETIFTIGHSTHTIEVFLNLLTAHVVTALCDVRSSPYSHMNPQFNREALQDRLKKIGITYIFLGKELGARSDDPTCYKHNQARYDLIEKTPLFQKGLDRVCDLSKQYRVALMCAEKDPLSCHRTILVARALATRGFPIEHVLGNGTIETHDQAILRLLKRLRLPETDMFKTQGEIIDEAYHKQGEAIAYQEKMDTHLYS